MPQSVPNAVPATVLPVSLSTAFERIQELPVVINEYRDGEPQLSRQAETSRVSWRLGKRLSAGALATLRTFHNARNGRQEAFYFYDPFETSPRFTLSPSGTTGRYTVRFDSDWSQSAGVGARLETEMVLIQVA
jgi:hypothetical protein